MKYRIFKREIYKKSKTDWEDTGKIMEAKKSTEAIIQWLSEYSPDVTHPHDYAAGRAIFSRNYCWLEIRDFAASVVRPEDEFFTIELKALKQK